MSRITIVRPPQILPFGTINTSLGVPSIGIAYLAGSLKAAGHRVTVVDAFGEAIFKFTRMHDSGLLINGLTASQIVGRIPGDVDVIGVSCMYSNEWLYSRVVIKKIMERFPCVPIIVGGEHVTAEPEYSLRTCPGLHSCVLGEGEETFVELIEAIEQGKGIDAIAGIAYLDGDGRFTKTPLRKRIRDIDQIPLPSWDEMPLEDFLSNGLGHNAIRGRNMPIMASRGCPYKCSFCSNAQMWRQRWIARDPQEVVRELKMWQEKYRPDNFEFYDLTTILRKDWIMTFTDLLIEQGLQISWTLASGTRSEALDADVLARLKQTGCHSLCYAPESGSPATLKRINKQVNLPNMLASMREAVKVGILVKSNIIFGFPGQTKKEVFQSFIFMVQMAWAGIADTAVFPFVPYPGSSLYDQLVGEGKIKKDAFGYEDFLSRNIYNEVSKMRSWSDHISDRQIKFLTIGGMAWFYFWQYLFRPWRIIVSACRVVKNKPKTMLEKAVDGIFRNFIQGRRRKNKGVDLEALPLEASPDAGDGISCRENIFSEITLDK